MKQIAILLALFATGWGAALGAPPSTNPASTNRILQIDPSSMPVAAGKTTLIIGPLRRTNDVYAGDYRIKVHPYFWKNEKGRLAIVVSDASLAAINQGKVTPITGTATTSGKGGQRRRIEATATPVDLDHGTLKLTFVAGERKMIFTPAYHLSEKETTARSAQTNETQL